MRSSPFIVLFAAALVGIAAISTNGCGVEPINSTFSFSIMQSEVAVEPASDTSLQHVSYSFSFLTTSALDSNGTAPLLITGAKLGRASLISASHDLGRFSNLQLFISSDSMPEVLAAQLATVQKADSSFVDLTPNFVEIQHAFFDSTIHLRLTGTLLRSPKSADTITLNPQFDLIAEPVSPP